MGEGSDSFSWVRGPRQYCVHVNNPHSLVLRISLTRDLPSLQSSLASFANPSQYSSFYLKRLGEQVSFVVYTPFSSVSPSFALRRLTPGWFEWIPFAFWCCLFWTNEKQRWKSMKRHCLVFSRSLWGGSA